MKYDQREIKISKDRKRIALELHKSVMEMKDKLNKMGIELPHYGPRISDPAHMDKTSWLYR